MLTGNSLGVTVSDFAVPNARARFPDELGPLVDPHVVNTVHELEWEGDEDLSEALGGTDGRFCLAYLDVSRLGTSELPVLGAGRGAGHDRELTSCRRRFPRGC